MIAPPVAVVVAVQVRSVTIVCPYCERPHTHAKEPRRRGRFWYAPQCGLMLNADARARGYTFHVGDGAS